MKTDRPHILCVNPWIHDFAAFDFWLKPLGLLTLAALLRHSGCRVSLMDCLDRFHPAMTVPPKVSWDGRGPFLKTRIRPARVLPMLPEPVFDLPQNFYRYGSDPRWVFQDLRRLDRPDLILVTSLMTYWASGVAETIALIRTVFPDVPVILGGKYATLCPDHARQWSGADQVISGRGESQLAAIIREYTGTACDTAFSDTVPDSFPALDLCRHLAFAPILTSRGCPFSCAYCASSILEPEMTRRDPHQVFEEICYWHEAFQVKNFAFYDDALLVNGPDHAYVWMDKLLTAGQNLFFHTPNALHIREISTEAAHLMFRCGFKTIRLGLETADMSQGTRPDIKVRAGEFQRAVDHLKAAGFSRDQVGAYLLCGLPGQNLDDVANSMKVVRDAGILPVPAYYTPIPGTLLWADATACARVDITRHPVYTNNSLFPCVRSREDITRIHRLKNI